MNLRSATDAQHMQLGFVETHVPKRKAGEEARQEDEHGYKHGEGDEFGAGDVFPLRIRVHRRGRILARKASELAQAMCGEGE